LDNFPVLEVDFSLENKSLYKGYIKEELFKHYTGKILKQIEKEVEFIRKAIDTLEALKNQPLKEEEKMDTLTVVLVKLADEEIILLENSLKVFEEVKDLWDNIYLRIPIPEDSFESYVDIAIERLKTIGEYLEFCSSIFREFIGSMGEKPRGFDFKNFLDEMMNFMKARLEKLKNFKVEVETYPGKPY